MMMMMIVIMMNCNDVTLTMSNDDNGKINDDDGYNANDDNCSGYDGQMMMRMVAVVMRSNIFNNGSNDMDNDNDDNGDADYDNANYIDNGDSD